MVMSKATKGRPEKFGEPSRQLNIKVPASKYSYIHAIVSRWVNRRFKKND